MMSSPEAVLTSHDEKNKGLKVDCSHGGLSTVPENLPLNTTSLYLNNNKIKHMLNHQFGKLTNLKYLNLNFNPIMDIHEDAFNNLYQLQELHFNGHNLNYSVKSLPHNVFKPLASLKRLSIRSTLKYNRQVDNFITTEKTFRYLVGLKILCIDLWIIEKFNLGFSELHNLQELDVSRRTIDGITFKCQLPNINNNTFVVFKSIPILSLNLHECVLNSIDKDAFAPLMSLQNIVLSTDISSSLGLPDLIPTLHVFKNKTIKSVKVDSYKLLHDYVHVSGYSLSLDILHDICIEYLDLSRNLINMVDFDKFLTIPIPRLTKCLRHLDLSQNRIAGIIKHPWKIYLSLPQFENLQYFDLSKQRTFDMYGNMHIHDTTQQNDIVLPFMVRPILLPKQLRYLYMDGAVQRFGSVLKTTFIGGTNMISLNLSYTKTTFYPKSKILGLENLQIIDFSNCDCRLIGKSFFDTFPNLTTLRLSNVNLDNDLIFNIGQRLFKPLTKLQNIDLTNNQLSILPADIFSGLTELKEISLSFNNLVSIPDLATLVNLQNIYLSYNALATVDDHTRRTLDELISEKNHIYVSLFGNTFGCTCESSSLLNWFYQTRVDLDGRNYSCINKMGEKTTTGLVSKHYRALRLDCVSGTWLTVAVTGISLLFVALLTMFVFVKNKLKIKLILLRMIGRYIKPRRREEFLHDVCILYEDDVYQWVCHDLRAELEVKRGLKLFIRDRDQIPGEAIPIDLYDTMNSSWKVALIVSPGFLASAFASATMSMCLSFITLATPNRLILIMDSSVNIPTNIDFFLESVHEENIYHHDITNGGADDPRFWNNIYHGIVATDHNTDVT